MTLESDYLIDALEKLANGEPDPDNDIEFFTARALEMAQLDQLDDFFGAMFLFFQSPPNTEDKQNG